MTPACALGRVCVDPGTHTGEKLEVLGAPGVVCSALPGTANPVPRFPGKTKAPDAQGPGRAGLETHTAGQAGGAEETLRALTSPGKTIVRQETHRRGWRAVEIRTRALTPLPRGPTRRHKENPRSHRPALPGPSLQSWPWGLSPPRSDSHRGLASDCGSLCHLPPRARLPCPGHLPSSATLLPPASREQRLSPPLSSPVSLKARAYCDSPPKEACCLKGYRLQRKRDEKPGLQFPTRATVPTATPD